MSSQQRDQYFILEGTIETATPIAAQFSAIQQNGATRMAASLEVARDNLDSRIATCIGKHSYSIWKLVPVESFIKESKPVEFTTIILKAES